MKRLLEKCEGSEGIERHRNNFKSLEAGTVPLGCVCGDADGYIVALVELAFSDREIRMLLGIGGYRISRVRQEMSNPSLRLKRHERKVPSHAFTEQDFENLKQHVATWNIRLEDGFACAHTIQKRYFKDEGILWKTLHAEYKKIMEEQGKRVMSCDRWTQYVHFFFPEIKLAASKEDSCDGCFAIDSQIRQ